MNVWADRHLGWGALPALVAALAAALALALLPLTWAVLLVAGAIMAALTLVHPQFGLLLLVPAVPFGSLFQVRLGAMNVGLTEALVALTLAAWLMRLVTLRRVSMRLPRLVLPFAALIAVLVLSLLGSASLSYSIKEVVKWLEVLALYVFVANELDVRWTKALVFVMLGTGALVALHGIYQFLFQVGPEGFVLFDRFMRAHGTFEQPNPYGGYLGLTLPLAVGLVTASVLRVGRRVRGTWLAWAGCCGLLMLTALAMSWSRGAWMGFAAALGVMAMAVAVRSGRAAVLVAVFAVILGYIFLAGGVARVPPAIVQRFSDFLPYMGVSDVRGLEVTDANFAVLERMAHWQTALDMWTEHPWLGIGVGNYEVLYSRYALPLWPLPLGHAHNYYLNIAAEAGVLGLAAYLLLWVLAFWSTWRIVQRTSGWYWGVALGVLGVLTHLSFHNLFDNLYVHGMYLQVAMLLGVMAVQWPEPQADTNDSAAQARSVDRPVVSLEAESGL